MSRISRSDRRARCCSAPRRRSSIRQLSSASRGSGCERRVRRLRESFALRSGERAYGPAYAHAHAHGGGDAERDVVRRHIPQRLRALHGGPIGAAGDQARAREGFRARAEPAPVRRGGRVAAPDRIAATGRLGVAGSTSCVLGADCSGQARGCNHREMWARKGGEVQDARAVASRRPAERGDGRPNAAASRKPAIAGKYRPRGPIDGARAPTAATATSAAVRAILGGRAGRVRARSRGRRPRELQHRPRPLQFRGGRASAWTPSARQAGGCRSRTLICNSRGIRVIGTCDIAADNHPAA
jgi:hypothetical protein